ncbi:MAG: hypothetical protein PHP01_02285 [Phycisphaerae bacterium]|nr:hypothetical protein [Phycisphaerae bacterium]
MKVCIQTINMIILALFGFVNMNYVMAESSPPNLKILWQKEYSVTNNITYAPHLATFCGKTNRIVIVGSSFRPRDPNFIGKIWIWDVDQNGEITRETILKEASRKECSAIGDMWPARGLEISENGDILMTGSFGKRPAKEPAIMQINSGKTEKKIKLIAEKNQEEDNILILKMANLINDNTLLIGKDAKGNGLIIKVDSQGNRLWKKMYKFGDNNIFTDSIPLKEKGEFVIVGLSFFMGDEKDVNGIKNNICMVKYNMQGQILSENVIDNGGTLNPYAYPQVCRLDSGNFVVVYDKSTTMKATDCWFEIFTPALEPLRKSQISKTVNTLAISGIRSIPKKGFLVADWLEFSGLTIHQYDEKGNEVGNVSVKDTTIFGSFNINIVCTANKGFIVVCTPFQGTITKTKIIALELK